MNITLISPRLAVQKGDFLGSGVPYWPVELAVVAAFLKQRGNEVAVLDLFGRSPSTLEEKGDHYLQGQSLNTLITSSAVSTADLFIVYAISYMSHGELLEIIRLLKASSPRTPVAVLENSQAVTAYSLSSISNDFLEAGADALICGELYWNWDEIEASLCNTQKVVRPENIIGPDSGVPQLVKRKIERHPSYPPPAWELFPLEGYWSLPYSHGPKQAKRFLPVLTSRGCPYPCDFCVVPETNSQRWRGRAAEEVVDELIYLRDKFGVTFFQIEDLNPTVQSARWDKICKLLLERDAQIFFSFVSGTKAETVRLDQVPLLAKAGCRYLSISPESGSKSVLEAIGKPFDHQHGLKLIGACKKHGIYTQACILVGHPNETNIDHQQSCDYLRQMVRAGLSEVAVFVVSSVAGSKLYSKRSIDYHAPEALPSFSPKGRVGWEELERRRQQLIKIFFVEKLRQGHGIWAQGIRAIFGHPRTKMENLPRRMIYVYRTMLRQWQARLRAS